MKHRIIDKHGDNVGYATILDGGDLSITFHDVWVGAFSTFEGWNCQHGLAYSLVNPCSPYNLQGNFLEMREQSIKPNDFNFIDISLVAEGGIPVNSN